MFVAIDKATGKLRFSKQGGSNGGQQYYSIVTDPKAGTIDVLNYGGQRVRFVPDDGKSVGAIDAGTPKGSEGPLPPAIPGQIAVPVRVLLPPKK